MATLCSILAWRIPWIEEPGGLQSMEPQRSDTTKVTQHAYTLRLQSRVNKPRACGNNSIAFKRKADKEIKGNLDIKYVVKNHYMLTEV